MMFARVFCLDVALVTVLSIAGQNAMAQTAPSKFVWEDFENRMTASQKIAPQGNNFAGDQVSLSNGALSFRVVDVSIPGPGPTVEFARTYQVMNRKGYKDTGSLGDWSIDVPRIGGIFSPDWVVAGASPQARCSQNAAPPLNPEQPFTYRDVWSGVRVSIPGVDQSEILWALPSTRRPDTGSYPWVTNARTVLSCLPSIKNGPGEGFLAVTPDGTKYWFDSMAQSEEPKLKQTSVPPGGGDPRIFELTRRQTSLYVTRVEDRFGNVVSYEYENAWNEPVKLRYIRGDAEASDSEKRQRLITIDYANNLVSKVTAGWRSWQYQYKTVNAKTIIRNTLERVLPPDASVVKTSWHIDFSAFTALEIETFPSGPTRNCLYSDPPPNFMVPYSGTVTGPFGAQAKFTVELEEHGSSHVPVACLNVTTKPGGPPGSGNKTDDDVNLWPIAAYSFTLKSKEISGPGITPAKWTYQYTPNTSAFFSEGQTIDYPVCIGGSIACGKPKCLSAECAQTSVTQVTAPNGDFKRYFHGNSYRYNEGKLIREEEGSAAVGVVRATSTESDLTDTSCRVGESLQADGYGWVSEYPRPMLKTSVEQQGRLFVRQTLERDALCRPTLVKRYTQASGGTGAPPPIKPPAPTITAPAAAVAGQAFPVSWTASSGAASYVLERRFGGSNYQPIYSGPYLSQTLMFDQVTTVFFRVKACNSFGTCGDPSSEVSVNITAPVLATPDLRSSATQVAEGAGFKLYWTAVSGAGRYELDRKVDAGSYSMVYGGSATEVSQSYPSVARLTFRVRACVDVGNCGPYSSEVSVQIVKGGGWCDPDRDPGCGELNRSPAPPAN